MTEESIYIDRHKVFVNGKTICRRYIKRNKIKDRPRAYECSMEYLNVCCEACGESDPYVMDIHHVIPKNHENKNKERVYLCANCHARCHRIWGGTHKNRPYIGPETKAGLIAELQKELGRYAYKNEPWRTRSGAILPSLIDKIKKDFDSSGASNRTIAMRHGVCRETVRKILIEAASDKANIRQSVAVGGE